MLHHYDGEIEDEWMNDAVHSRRLEAQAGTLPPIGPTGAASGTGCGTSNAYECCLALLDGSEPLWP